MFLIRSSFIHFVLPNTLELFKWDDMYMHLEMYSERGSCGSDCWYSCTLVYIEFVTLLCISTIGGGPCVLVSVIRFVICCPAGLASCLHSQHSFWLLRDLKW